MYCNGLHLSCMMNGLLLYSYRLFFNVLSAVSVCSYGVNVGFLKHTSDFRRRLGPEVSAGGAGPGSWSPSGPISSVSTVMLHLS